MEQLYCVYKHTAPNGKVYVGQTKTGVKDRWKAGKGYTCHRHGWFWKAIEKYGWSNIKHEILVDDLNKKYADYYEKYFIDLYQSTDKRYGYNCQTGGSRDYKYSEESKKKISDSLKKLYAIAPPDINKARAVLQEKQGRRIVQYDLDGNRLAEYKSALDAFSQTGVSNKKINACVGRRVKRAGLFMWRYAENAPEKIPPYEVKNPCNQYDIDGNFIKHWDDVKDADTYYAFGKKKGVLVQHCCEGKYKTAYKYQWRYGENPKKKIKPLQIGKPILQYDKNGKFIRRWNNSMEVKDVLGWEVKNACEHRSKTAYGYQWRYEEDETPLQKIEKPHIANKKIRQYSIKGNLIAEYETTRKAEKATGINYKNIQCCAQGKNATAGGYAWKYVV